MNFHANVHAVFAFVPSSACQGLGCMGKGQTGAETLGACLKLEFVSSSAILRLRCLGKRANWGRNIRCIYTSNSHHLLIEVGKWQSQVAKMAENVIDKTLTLKKEAARRVKTILITEDMVDNIPPESNLDDGAVDDLIVKCAVSFDGTWNNGGFCSPHCVVITTISVDSGEVLDTEYISNQQTYTRLEQFRLFRLVFRACRNIF